MIGRFAEKDLGNVSFAEFRISLPEDIFLFRQGFFCSSSRIDNDDTFLPAQFRK
ncbi:hypothetical protein BH20VER2_BH20VER2_04740 [soil metagenome]